MSSDADRQDADFRSEMVEPQPVAARQSGPFALRTILYGGLVVAGGALMAVSAKPELAGYVPFVPEKEKPASTCALSKGPSCCAQAAGKAAVAVSEGSCCASVSRFAAATCVSEADLATGEEVASVTPPAPPLPERL